MATFERASLSGYARDMLITPRDIEVFKALNRYRWLRANFIHRLVGGSKQHVHRRLGWLYQEGLLGRPEQQKQSWNARYAPRVYELTPKSRTLLQNLHIPLVEWKGSKTFWHQLMISDIASSFELAARFRGLPFRTKHEIIGDHPLSLPCNISYRFRKHTEQSDKNVQPDGLFSVGNAYFVLEADRGSETIMPATLGHSSYLRKLLQYEDVFAKRTYQTEWDIPTLFVLNVFVSKDHCANVMACRAAIGKGKSRGMLFKSIPILGSWERHPEPLINLLDDPWERVGNEPHIIGKEHDGYTKTA